MWKWVVEKFILPAVVRGIKVGVKEAPYVEKALKNLEKTTFEDLVKAILKETKTKKDDIIADFITEESLKDVLGLLFGLIKTNKIDVRALWFKLCDELKKELE